MKVWFIFSRKFTSFRLKVI